MINRIFKHIQNLSIFNTKKVSSGPTNEGYYIGNSIEQIGDPSILWTDICFIEQEKLIWTHGEFYAQEQVVPTKISDLTNDSSFITLVDVSTKAEKILLNNIGPTNNVSISPNVYNNLGTLYANTSINLLTPGDNTIYNEYMLSFSISGSNINISFSPAVTWQNDEAPEYENNATYEISIVNNHAIFGKF